MYPKCNRGHFDDYSGAKGVVLAVLGEERLPIACSQGDNTCEDTQSNSWNQKQEVSSHFLAHLAHPKS